MNKTPYSELLRELLDYNPETGQLFWRPRKRYLFKHERDYTGFNSTWAGQPALNSVSNKGYLVGTLLNKTLSSHQAIWCLVYGDFPPKGYVIDHINGQPTDNRISNLRCVTHQGNSKNKKLGSNNNTGQIGVTWDRQAKKWKVSVAKEKKLKFVGRFLDFNEACAARKQAEKDCGYHKNHGRIM